jgi:hypothetical protein
MLPRLYYSWESHLLLIYMLQFVLSPLIICLLWHLNLGSHTSSSVRYSLFTNMSCFQHRRYLDSFTTNDRETWCNGCRMLKLVSISRDTGSVSAFKLANTVSFQILMCSPFMTIFPSHLTLLHLKKRLARQLVLRASQSQGGTARLVQVSTHSQGSGTREAVTGWICTTICTTDGRNYCLHEIAGKAT